MTYLHPFFAVFLIITVSGIFFHHQTRTKRLFLVAAAALTLFSWLPAAHIALVLLESHYSHEPPSDRAVQAIVVLSSSVYRPDPPLPDPIVGGDTYLRCEYAAWLYKHWLSVPVLASGRGSGPAAPYAASMAKVLQESGVPQAMIWREEISHSTYENAFFSAQVLKRKGIHKIALVTQAYHMLRAQKCFEKQGLAVVPAACGFRSDTGWTLETLLPNSQAISWNEDSVHELFGLLWYDLRGWI